jgi:hypothetical protein
MPRRRGGFQWRIATLLAMLFGLPVLTFAAWFAWELRPLEGYYLTAYRQASKGAEDSGSAVEVRWLMKAAPGRASRLAIPSDVVTGWAGNLSIHLSSLAAGDGWVSLEKSAPDLIKSAELEELLRTCIYKNRSYPDLLRLPLLEGCTLALLMVGYFTFLMKDELWQECQRFWQEVAGRFPSRNRGWDSWPEKQRADQGIVHRITLQNLFEMVRAKWIALRVPSSNKSGKEEDYAGSSARESSRDYVCVERDDPGINILLESPHASRVKKSIPNQSIFPGARGENVAPQQPVEWDESMWID